MSKRRKFRDKFKREAVGLIDRQGANVSKIARDIGVGAAVLGGLRSEQKADTTRAFTGSSVPRDQEMATLRRELARVNRREVFARYGSVLRQRIELKYLTIQRHRGFYPVPLMC